MGPLQGLRVIEMVGLGPAPFCGMMLADMGAEVIRVDRPSSAAFGPMEQTEVDFNHRGKKSVTVNLKEPGGVEKVFELIESADALIEGYRPGVMEKLGLGPDECLRRNPRLVFGRMTGWGQTGPLAPRAGHDLNYIALTGALHSIGRAGEKPTIPLNLVGDFGGGGLMLAFGVVCAMLESARSGRGQVVDAAMIDGASALMASTYATFQGQMGHGPRGTNLLDGGAPFYEVYETRDGKYVSIGSIEPQFYALLLEKLGLPPEDFRVQFDPRNWPAKKDAFAELFKQKTRDEWCELMEHEDICFAPVLSLEEVRRHPHHQERGTFLDDGKVWQPAPAPRFSRTIPDTPRPTVVAGAHNDEFGGTGSSS